jgi:filamentous hemagglutinin family protein
MAVRVNRRKLKPGCKKNRSSHSLRLTITAAMAVATGISMQRAGAAVPIALTRVEHGSATISNSGSLATITAANRTVIDYSEFNIPTGDTVRFIQPSASSMVLNRISGAAPSQIDGNLFANGIVYLVNPAGVMFGNNSVINVGQIFAAAGNMSNQDFLSGTNHFTDVNGAVMNAGNINASAVNFVGSVVANSGEILAPSGTVVMASGHDVTLGQLDGNLYVQIDNTGVSASSSSAAAVSNTGTISAKGGHVTMAAGDLLSLSIQNSGSIQSSDVSIQGGANSNVIVSGSIDASNPNGAGGTVAINGGNIGVGVVQNPDGTYADAPVAINASGSTGGGKILIGVTPDSSSKTGYSDASNYDYISSKATLTADASVKGNGGLVDTSGATLTVAPGATISTQGAGGGNAGEWLLDPVNINITNTPTSGNIDGGAGGYTLAGTVYFSPDAAAPSPASVFAGDLVTALDDGDNVTIQTVPVTGPDIGSDAGNIVLLSGVSIDPTLPGGNVTLTLAATSNISILGNIQPTAASAGTLNVVLSAGGSVYIGGAFTGGTMHAGPGFVSTFSTGFGGNVVFEVGGDIELDSTNPDLIGGVPLGGAINTSGTLGGGAIEIGSENLISIQPGGASLTTGGIFTGGGGLEMDSESFNIGAVTLSTAGYGPGTGGGAMMIYSEGLSLDLDGVVIDTQGALGGDGTAGGGGAVGIFSLEGLQDDGLIVINDVTFETGGSGGGTVVVFPGGGSYYDLGNNLFDISAGYLDIEGTNIITSAPLAGVTSATVGRGGGITIVPNFAAGTIEWTMTGGAGGYTAAGAGNGAAQGGEVFYGAGIEAFPSGEGVAASGVPALTAAPIVFTALQTNFMNGGTPVDPIAPSVTSDGGGQIYMNAFKIPAIPHTDYDDQFVVGNITLVNNTLVQDTGAISAADSSYGVIDFDGLVNDGPVGSSSNGSLTVATASGDIAFDFPVGLPLSYNLEVGTTAISISVGQPLSSLSVWAGYDLTSLELNNSAKYWVATEAANTGQLTIGQIQLGATTEGLEPVGDAYMANLKQIFPNSYGVTNGNSYSTAGNKDNPFYLDESTIAPLEFGSGAYQDVINNSALVETSGSMFLQGILVEENVKNFGKVNGIDYDYVGSTTLISSGGDIDLDPFSYYPFEIATFDAGANDYSSELTLISAAPATINGNYLGSGSYTVLSNNNAINVDGSIPAGGIIYWGADGPGAGIVTPNDLVPAGSIILPSTDRSLSVFSVSGNDYVSLSAGITATPGLIVPVTSIYAIGLGFTVVPLSPYPYGINPNLMAPAPYGLPFVNDGFMAVASYGGNIFVGGPSPAPSNGGPLNDGHFGFGGYTIGDGEILILATNTSSAAGAASGNIEIGPGAFLDGAGGIASISTSGNSGNITFDNGARSESELVVTLTTASSSAYSSGNIIFQPSTTGVESNITSDSAYIGSVAFAGNSGKISLGYDVNINTTADIEIESVTGDNTELDPFTNTIVPVNEFQADILNLIETVTVNPLTGEPTVGGLFGVPLTYLNVGNQPLVYPAGTSAFSGTADGTYNILAAPTGLTGITGNSGNVSIGAGDQINCSTGAYGSIAIGSYSSIGNSGNITTGPTSKISSSGTLELFSEAGYQADAQGFGNPAVSGTSGYILIQGGVVNTNTNPTDPTSPTETMQLITTGTGPGAGYAVTYGNIMIASASYTVPTDTSITVAGAGYLSTTNPLGSAGYINVTANVLTINDAADAAYASAIAINTSGKEAGYINLFGYTGVNIISGEITSQGGLPGHVAGSGGGVSISSAGYVNIGAATGTVPNPTGNGSYLTPASLANPAMRTAVTNPGEVTINSSSAYAGGGGGVAIFSTNLTDALTINGLNVNTSGAGFLNTDGLNDLNGGGGGAVAIFNTGDIFLNNVIINTSFNIANNAVSNGSGAVVINSASGYIAFTDTSGGVNEFSTGVAGPFPAIASNANYGGGGGVVLIGSLSSGGELFVGGGGGAKGGYAGGGVEALIPGGGAAPEAFASSGYGAGNYIGGGVAGGSYGIGGGSGVSSSGNYYYAGSNPGSATYLALYGSQIQFGAPTNATLGSSGNYNPVSLITTSSGQYFGDVSATDPGYNNNTIVLYATATIQAGLPNADIPPSLPNPTPPAGTEWDITFGTNSTINQAASLILPVTPPGTGGLNVVNYNGNINFEGDIGNTGELSSLSASIIPFPSTNNWQIRLFTNGESNSGAGGYFSSTTFGNQSFNGNVVLENGGSATSGYFKLLTQEGGSIQITGSLTDSTGVPFNVSLESSATYGNSAILIGGSVTTNGGYFRAVASSGYSIIGGIGSGNIAIGAANYDGSINNTLTPVISTSGGNVLIESTSNTGPSGYFTPLGALSIESGGGYVIIESISTDGSSGTVNLGSKISIDSSGNYIKILSTSNTAAGGVTLGGTITSEGGYVLVESNSTTGSSGTITGQGAFSITSGSGTITIESLAGGGASGNITLNSTASPMLSSDDATITILTQSTNAGSSSGYITLGGAITSDDGNVFVESNSTAGASGNITGQSTDLGAFSIQSGGGYVTIESLAAGGDSGNISLVSTASPMIDSGGNTITILTQSTSAGGVSGTITLGGSITSEGGYVLVESNSTAGASGSITGQDAFSITSGGGAITIESLAAGGDSGNITLNSTASPMLSSDDAAITILTQSINADSSSGYIVIGGAVTSGGGYILVKSNSTGSTNSSSGYITLNGAITSDDGNVEVESNSTGSSGNITGENAFSINSGTGTITIESLAAGGDSGNISLTSTASPMLGSDDATITVLTQSTNTGSSSGYITLDGLITSDGGNVLVESNSAAGASGNITGNGAYFSIQSGGGTVTLESLAVGSGGASGNITLGGLITSQGGVVLVESDSTLGASGNITGQDPLSIQSGSGTITIESLAGGGNSGNITLNSTASPMLGSDDAKITVLTQSTHAGSSSGHIVIGGAVTSGGGYILVESNSIGSTSSSSGYITLNGVITSDDGNVEVETNSTGSSGNITGENAFSINSGTGTLTVESLAAGGDSGNITLNSTASPMLGSDDAKITVLTQSTHAGSSSGHIVIGGAVTSGGGYILVESNSIGSTSSSSGYITLNGVITSDDGNVEVETNSTGSSGNITGENAFSINSGGGFVTIESLAGGAGDSGEVSLNSTANPMIDSDGGQITIESNSNVTAGGVSIQGGGINSSANVGGGITISSANGPVTVSGIAINSSGAAGNGGAISISSTGAYNVSLTGITINSSASSGHTGGAVDVSAGGNLKLAGAIAINTSGSSASGAITLDSTGGYVSLPATGSIGITFGSPISGAGYDTTISAKSVNILGSITLEPTSTGPMTMGVTASDGTVTLASINGAIALTASGTAGVNLSGPIGQTTALKSVDASSSAGYVTVADAITTSGNITLTPSTTLAGPILGSGDYRPVGLLTINGNLDSTGGSIALGGALTEVPSVATIVGNFNGIDAGVQTNLTITANDNVTMGQDQKFTDFGNLTITAGVEAQLGDINTVGNSGDMTVTAPSIVIDLRPPGQLLTSLGSLNGDLTPPPSIVDGTDFVASGKITFTGTISTTGAGAVPMFASSTESGVGSSVPGYTVLSYGLPSLAGNPLAGKILAILAAEHISIVFQGSPIPDAIALDNNIPLDLNAQDLPPQVIALYNQAIESTLLLSQTNISTIIQTPGAPPSYPVVGPPQPGTGGQLSLQGAGLDLNSPTMDEILALISGNGPVYGPLPPFAPTPQNITTLSLGNDSLNQLLSDYYALFYLQGNSGAPANWFQGPAWYEIVGQRKAIQKTLSLAYSIYLNSTQYDMSQQAGFVDFLKANRGSDPTLAQALSDIQQISAICDDMYQAGVTPGQFQNVEDAFLGPLTPDGMSEEQFISIVAPQQLQLTMR